jgi:hypothetical protein
LNNEILPHLLESGGTFVLEKRTKEAASESKLWRVIRQKKYGATEVLFLEPVRNRQVVPRSVGEG